MFPLPSYSLGKNIRTAEDLLKALFTSEESQVVSKFIKESIEYAEKLDKEKVSVSYRKDKKIIRVNVGRLEVVSLSRNGLLIVLDYSLLFDELKEMLDGNWQYPEDRPTAYRNLDQSCRIRLDAQNLKNFYSIFRKANDQLISKAINTGKNVWLKADSKETRETINKFFRGLNSFEDDSQQVDNEIITEEDYEEKISIKSYSDKDLLSRVSIDISEELADDLLMGDVASIAKIIKAIENELYN